VIGAICLFANLSEVSAQTAPAQPPPSQGVQAHNGEAASVPSPRSFSVSPYLWFAGLDGRVGVNQRLPSVDVDVNFSEIFKSIDWLPPPVMVVGEVRYGRFAAFTDFIFLGLEDDKGATRGPISVTADVKLDTIVWTFGGAYRVIDMDRGSLDLLAGGRLWNADVKGTLAGPLAVRQRSGSKTWVDPIIGINGRIELGSGFALQAEADVGGFGVASDIDWQVLGTLQYQPTEWATLEAGYRYLAVDFDDNGFLFDVALQGPIIGASFRF